jgi:hypothetical protein
MHWCRMQRAMDSVPRHNGGGSPSRHPLEDRLVRGIGRAADALSRRVERAYAKLDETQEELAEWQNRARTYWKASPERVVSICFLSGVLAGLWLGRLTRTHD